LNHLARTILSLRHPMRWRRACVLAVSALCLCPQWAAGTAPSVSPATPPAADAADELADVMVETREPRYVAPTIRDQIGRIWAPVLINGRGPFRLVLDTGASHSAVTALVALALGIPPDDSTPVMLRGVTGSAPVPTIHVDSLSVGELDMVATVLPIVPDAMGGAEGVLGYEGLSNTRIFIDFRHDKIAISYSRDQRAGHGFVTVPFRSIRGQLIVIDALIGQIHAKAIIDTGGETTIANLALRDALAQHSRRYKGLPDHIVGATKDVEDGEIIPMPAIEFGSSHSIHSIHILDSGVTFADVYIFKQWNLTHEPAILIGMDALGLLDVLVIDYREHELQILTGVSG
jgi:predicted aspartyl protease